MVFPTRFIIFTSLVVHLAIAYIRLCVFGAVAVWPGVQGEGQMPPKPTWVVPGVEARLVVPVTIGVDGPSGPKKGGRQSGARAQFQFRPLRLVRRGGGGGQETCLYVFSSVDSLSGRDMCARLEPSMVT